VALAGRVAETVERDPVVGVAVVCMFVEVDREGCQHSTYFGKVGRTGQRLGREKWKLKGEGLPGASSH
jgi:hypothetical protein